jgi:hypothetical protein
MVPAVSRLTSSVASGLVASLVIVLVGALLLGARQSVHSIAASHQTSLTLDQESIGQLNYGIGNALDRWYGVPRLFVPAPIANTDFIFFDVTGTTQQELEASFKSADICKTYGPCLVDPAVPSGVTLGLEGDKPAVTYYYCYSPSTTVLPWKHFIVLPRWSPPADGSIKRSLVDRWNDLARTIYIHEAGHVAVAEQDFAALNAQAEALPTCQAVFNFWDNPHVLDNLSADQNAYHARLRADCRPEIGCIPAYWEGWIF